MNRPVLLLPHLATQLSLGGVVLGVLITGALTPAIARPVKPAESMQVAQLFRRPPSSPSTTPYSYPPAVSPSRQCGSTGCRLGSGAQTVLRVGDKLMAVYKGKDQQVLQTGETKDLVLTLSKPIVSSTGRVIIPAESTIEGRIVPVEGGGQFVASRIVVNGSSRTFAAQSNTIHDVKDPNQTSLGAIAGDAAIGAAGGIVVGQVLGQRGITLEQVLGGAAAGVVVGNVTAPQAVVISPNQEIELQVTENFRF